MINVETPPTSYTTPALSLQVIDHTLNVLRTSMDFVDKLRRSNYLPTTHDKHWKLFDNHGYIIEGHRNIMDAD